MIILILEVNKHLFKDCILLEIDFQTHVFGYPNVCLDILTRVFGYLITRVWICSLPSIKEYLCESNEALRIINEFEKTGSHTRAIF